MGKNSKLKKFRNQMKEESVPLPPPIKKTTKQVKLMRYDEFEKHMQAKYDNKLTKEQLITEFTNKSVFKDGKFVVGVRVEEVVNINHAENVKKAFMKGGIPAVGEYYDKCENMIAEIKERDAVDSPLFNNDKTNTNETDNVESALQGS